MTIKKDAKKSNTALEINLDQIDLEELKEA
jgi:hypothetical protein